MRAIHNSGNANRASAARCACDSSPLRARCALRLRFARDAMRFCARCDALCARPPPKKKNAKQNSFLVPFLNAFYSLAQIGRLPHLYTCRAGSNLPKKQNRKKKITIKKKKKKKLSQVLGFHVAVSLFFGFLFFVNGKKTPNDNGNDTARARPFLGALVPYKHVPPSVDR